PLALAPSEHRETLSGADDPGLSKMRIWALWAAPSVLLVSLPLAEADHISISLVQTQVRPLKTRCLRFMHIPKTGGTSIDAENLRHAIKPFDSLMLRTFHRLARVHDWNSSTMAERFQSTHQDSFWTYINFIAGNAASYHFLPAAPDRCEDLHMPPSQSKFIRDYYDSCETFCTLRDPLERFWSAFQNWSPTCDPLGIEAEAVELLKELKQRPYQRDCFFVPQVEMVYGTRRISNGMHQYCDRFLHQENLSAEFHELMVERGRPEDGDFQGGYASLIDGTARAKEFHGDSGCGGAPDSEERRAEHTAQILDLPSPWSERPDIPREKFHARCYQGEKTIFYHKCKVEQYAPYTQDDGLVQRMTLYKDVRRQIPLEIRERFKHRKDKLIERKRRPMQNETIERFLPGRPSTSATNAGGALKEFREISALSRELIFYKSRLDGLVRSVEIIGRKMFEYFEDRDDRLIYHSVTLDPSSLTSGTLRTGTKSKDTYNVESVGDVPIKKMTEKFRRNPEVPADEDIAKISFYLTEQSSASIYSSTGKIRVDYHRDPGSLTFRQCMYHYEDGNLRRRPASLPQPTQAEVHKLLQMQST
ncbi:unnamed protein product, partial [Durusdinium trenchii]